jgi:hypothetical protein
MEDGMRGAWIAAALGLAACGGKATDETDTLTLDIDIDGLSKDVDNVNSAGTRMCTDEDGAAYVVWTDDRDRQGYPAVWFNRSLDGETWLASPIRINSGDDETRAYAPAIGCTTNGVFVAWEDDRDGDILNHNIYLDVSYDKGASFRENDILLDGDPDGTAFSVGPYVEAVGTDVYVAWFDQINGAYDIYMASSIDNGESFREPVRVDSDTAGAAYSAWPQVRATPAGTVYVVWEDSRSGASDVYFAWSDNAGLSFAPDIRIDGGDDAGSNNSFEPRLGADGNDVYVVWFDERNGEGRDVFLNYSSNGGADWKSVAERVDSDNAGFFHSKFPQVAVTGNVAHVVWQDNRETNYDVYYRRAIGGNFGDAEVIVEHDASPGFSVSSLPLIDESRGAIVVGWTDARQEAVDGGDDGYTDLYYATSGDGANWGDEDLRVDVLPPGVSYKVDVNMQIVGGYVYFAWTDGRNGNDDVYYNRLPIGEGAVIPETTTGSTTLF